MNITENNNEDAKEILLSLVNLKQDDMAFQELSDSVDSMVIGEAYYSLAKLYYDKADLNKAKRFFKMALQKCELPRDFYSQFKILGFLIRICSEQLDSLSAEKFIKESEELMAKAPQLLGTLNAEFFYNQGVLYTYRGKFFDAKEDFLLALKKSREENEPTVLAKTLHSLATNAFNFKDFNQALSYLEQLKELLQILQKTYMFGTMNLLYGNIYSELKEMDKAREYFELASKSLQDKVCWNLQGYVLLGQGIVHKKMGDYTKAIWYLKHALSSIDLTNFARLTNLLRNEIADINDSNIDIYMDRTNRQVQEKVLGKIDFKHRFVLLEILFLLAQNSGTYYDKEDLAKQIWKDEYNPLIHDKLIYTSISRLRKLIEPKGEKRKYILRGKDGYTFNPNVRARFHKEGKSGDSLAIGNVELASPV